MNSQSGIQAATLAVLVSIMLSGAVVWELRSRVAATDASSSEITRSFLRLEQAIGYVGLIHHFKNAVLRPAEPVYVDQAKTAYVAAVAELNQLQALLNRASIEVDLSVFKATIDQYDMALSRVRAAQLRGAGIAEVDRLVRIDDIGAQTDLFALEREIDALLESRRKAASKWLLAGLVVIVLLIAALIALIVYLGLRRGRQRLLQHAYDIQQQELEQEKAHAEEMGRLISQLEHTNREQAEFTYAISHDLKSPANTIGMLIEELAADETLNPDARALLADMESTTRRMRQLVDDVLQYSRVVDERMSVEAVDLGALVEEIRRDLACDIAKAGARISVTDLPSLPGNRMQLRMLFQNLVCNAVKFRAPDRQPRIEITSRIAQEGLEVTIADNGIGIPEKYRERVFGLFQRLNAPSEYEGTGLGLAICQRIMSNHRGRIRIGPGIDGGAAFTMYFPGGQA